MVGQVLLFSSMEAVIQFNFYWRFFLWRQYMCFASHLVVLGLYVEVINLVSCLLPRSSENPELRVCCVAFWKED